MTESEATKVIEGHIQFLRENWKPHPDYSVIEALGEAIFTIEEIQQYRAIGTVGDVKEIFSLCKMLQEVVGRYMEVGTTEEVYKMGEEFRELKEIDEDLRLKYCYEDLSSAENRGYMQGYNTAVNDFANFIHEKAKEKNGLRLSAETRSWTHPSIFDYVEEFNKREESVENE